MSPRALRLYNYKFTGKPISLVTPFSHVNSHSMKCISTKVCLYVGDVTSLLSKYSIDASVDFFQCSFLQLLKFPWCYPLITSYLLVDNF